MANFADFLRGAFAEGLTPAGLVDLFQAPFSPERRAEVARRGTLPIKQQQETLTGQQLGNLARRQATQGAQLSLDELRDLAGGGQLPEFPVSGPGLEVARGERAERLARQQIASQFMDPLFLALLPSLQGASQDAVLAFIRSVLPPEVADTLMRRGGLQQPGGLAAEVEAGAGAEGPAQQPTGRTINIRGGGGETIPIQVPAPTRRQSMPTGIPTRFEGKTLEEQQREVDRIERVIRSNVKVQQQLMDELRRITSGVRTPEDMRRARQIINQLEQLERATTVRQ